MSKDRTTQITEGVIWKQLLNFFFPILIGTFFQQMYNTVDTIIVGRFVGTQALAAVGSTSSLISLINGFFIGRVPAPLWCFPSSMVRATGAESGEPWVPAPSFP